MPAFGSGNEWRDAVRDCRVPIIARVNGLCLAGGMGIFGLCDIAVAAEGAKFGMPEVKIGLFPMQILTMLRDLIPPRLMNEMCMTAKPIDARTAMMAGLLNRVVPADQLVAQADALVDDLVAASPMAIRRGKYALRTVEGMTFDAFARILAEGLGGQLGEKCIVENHGGASGAIGLARVANELWAESCRHAAPSLAGDKCVLPLARGFRSQLRPHSQLKTAFIAASTFAIHDGRLALDRRFPTWGAVSPLQTPWPGALTCCNAPSPMVTALTAACIAVIAKSQAPTSIT